MKTSAGILLYRRVVDGNAVQEAPAQSDLFADGRQTDLFVDADASSDPAPGATQSEPAARVLEVLLVHPGGPFWTKKDAGAWSIPKGQYEKGEDAVATARREFAEELGVDLPEGELVPLGEIKQKGGKVITAWAVEGDIDASAAKSNTFQMEYPPRSGRFQDFPEVDRAEWFSIADARGKINPAQAAFLDRLLEVI
jgi:predicted NUDIX family NTP pyrophosphohydrolase